MNAIVVVGAGGHGKVVCDALQSIGETVEGFVDDQRGVGDRVLGLPVLGDTAWLAAHPRRIALGIGDNARRQAVADRLQGAGCVLARVIHAAATVAPSATILEGTVVLARAVINPDAKVDRGTIINTAAVVEHDCVVGAYAHLSPSAALGGGARIGALVHVGLGAVVLPLVTVGDRAIVGAGAVVNRHVEAGVVVRGVPARLGRILQ